MGTNGTHDPKQQANNSTAVELESQAEEQEDALESLLNKVDLNAPLEIGDYHGNLVQVPKDKFVEYWMPPGTSQIDAFHCMQAVRAMGLNIFAPGEVYFFKTADGPVKPFVGYTAYLRKAYEAGLEHIQKPEIDFGDDPSGYPISCTITIKMKDRENMEWTTWFSEVAGTMKEGLNKRWKKAPIQMLIKCAITNILRLSGLIDFTMPYTVDEMDDPTVPGHRTLTQEQLDVYAEPEEEAEITPGEVSATHHQVDMTSFRKTYFKALGKRNILQDETERQDWQEEKVGKRHTGDWEPDDYDKAMDIIHTIPIPEAEVDQSSGDEFLDGLPNEPVDDGEPPAQTEGSKEQDGTDQGEEQKITKETREALTELVKTFPGGRYKTIRSDAFKARAKLEIDRWVQSITSLKEGEAQKVIASLEAEKKIVLADEETEMDGVSGAFADNEAAEQEAEKASAPEIESFAKTPEWNKLNREYNERTQKFFLENKMPLFESPDAEMDWREDITGIQRLKDMQAEHFAQLQAELDVAIDNQAATPDPAIDGKCSEKQYEQIKDLCAKWLPDKVDHDGNSTAIGSGQIQAFARGIVHGFTRTNEMTTEQASDLILALQDKLEALGK